MFEIPATTCNVCGKEAHFYWKKGTGEKLDLCTEHYEAMEREVHLQEKQSRLARNIIGVVAGREYANQTCPRGKDCKYCKEVGL